MRKKHYIVNPDKLKIEKKFVDLESNEGFYSGKEQRIKCWNELDKNNNRTGNYFEERNIFNNERDAKMRLDIIILEKIADIDIKKNELDIERNKLLKLLTDGRK